MPDPLSTLPAYLDALMPSLRPIWPGASWSQETIENGALHIVIDLPSVQGIVAGDTVTSKTITGGGFSLFVLSSGATIEGPCPITLFQGIFGGFQQPVVESIRVTG